MKNLSEYIISKGTPVFNGITEGRVMVVETSKDFPKVLNNPQKVILIVKNFDPNYDILIEKSLGVVSELGNILCHLAIVSRVRKIPAIVNAKNITSLVKDSEKITLDSYKGIIYSGLHGNQISLKENINLIQN